MHLYLFDLDSSLVLTFRGSQISEICCRSHFEELPSWAFSAGLCIERPTKFEESKVADTARVQSLQKQEASADM